MITYVLCSEEHFIRGIESVSRHCCSILADSEQFDGTNTNIKKESGENMQQFKHQDFELYPFELYPRGVEKGKHDRDRQAGSLASAKGVEYASGYRAPLLPSNVIQELLDAGFEYHLHANNDPGFWTHPLIAKVLFSTHQAMSRLGFVSTDLLPGPMNNSCRLEQHRQWSP